MLGSWEDKVARYAVRFARKYYAAVLLNNKLFGGETFVQETLQEIRESPISDDSEMKEVLALTTVKLQKWVRGAILSDPLASDRMKEWIQIIVKPALAVNCASVPDRMCDIIARFTCIIAGGEASEQDVVDLKMATSCVRGDFHNHPFLQGLALSCRRKLLREARGIMTMAGRRDDASSLENSLVADAGLSLSIACGNTALARMFGMSSTCLNISLDELPKHSLPTGALSVLWDDVLRENFVLADQMFQRHPSAPQRALV